MYLYVSGVGSRKECEDAEFLDIDMNNWIGVNFQEYKNSYYFDRMYDLAIENTGAICNEDDEFIVDEDSNQIIYVAEYEIVFPFEELNLVNYLNDCFNEYDLLGPNAHYDVLNLVKMFLRRARLSDYMF